VLERASRIDAPPLTRHDLPDSAVFGDDVEALMRAGWLEDVAGFDAGLFGMSAFEAAAMDPNHRLILELGWEALESAGLGTAACTPRTAVYTAVGFNDYGLLSLHDPEALTAFTLTGNAPSFASHRLSHLFGFRGPSLTVEAACASSLTAVHLACQSLRLGEADMALVAAANTITHAAPTLAEARAWLLSPTGSCRAFDENADGTVRGEGGGAVVLKRLDDALRDGDPIRAVIRGTAAHHRGRAANGGGLTTPDAEAEASVIQAALVAAGVDPQTIGYIETHGGGTPMADNAELWALDRVYGGARARLPLGALKPVLGHLEQASGIVALIKLVMAVERATIPPALPVERPHSLLADGANRLALPTTSLPWPPGPRRAGVSAFAAAGGGAHVIVEEAPPPRERIDAVDDRSSELMCLSAQTPGALAELAARYRAALASERPPDWRDLCHTANAGRSRLPRRVAVVASSAAELAERLEALAREDGSSAAIQPPATPKVAFLLTGQGSQYPGMGAALYQTQPLFRNMLDRCDAIVRLRLGRSLLEVTQISGSAASDEACLDDTRWAQPAIFAIDVAMATLWMDWGCRPSAVIGHSLGEYAAAYVAGALSLEEALGLVCERARLMGALPQGGGMLALLTDEATAREAMRPWADQLSIAAINGPRHVVVSGPRTVLEPLAATLEERDVPYQPLAVSHAFHSAAMDPVMPALERAALEARLVPPRLPLVSNVTGLLFDAGAAPDPGYWAQHLRAPVLFHRGLITLREAGIDTFLEVGPGQSLSRLGARGLPGPELAWLASLSSDRPPWTTVLDAAAKLYARGVDLDAEAMAAGFHRRRIPAPTYPFQRRRCWIQAQAPPVASADRSPPPESPHAPLLDVVRAEVAALLPPDARVDEGRGFFDLGLDSLAVAALPVRLGQRLGRPLPPTLGFDHPTTTALADALGRMDSGRATATGHSPVAPPPARGAPDLAITGVACRFPGGANGPDELWRVLVEGVQVIVPPPADRPFAHHRWFSDPTLSWAAARGGFLDDLGSFDPRTFGLSPRAAAVMDPQHRLALEVAWEALDDAGLLPTEQTGARIGVFVGAVASEHARVLPRAGVPLDAHAGLGNLVGAIAGRISHSLGTRGPSLVVDTACSSSLMAVTLACEALARNEVDVALAGGVNVLLDPEGYEFLARAGALSRAHRCASFDASADGYVRSEGCGFVVIERGAGSARRDHRARALISGWAVNHDGRSAGMTVPSGTAQRQLLEAALCNAGVGAAELAFVETHGTGTPLGDPIEAAALADVLGRHRAAAQPLWLGALKSCLGHMEAAAGIGGLIKAVLSLEKRLLPANRNFQNINPRIDLVAGRVRPAAEPVVLDAGPRPLIAGVSAFGLTGTNVHVLIESAHQSGFAGRRPPPRKWARQRCFALGDLVLRGRDVQPPSAGRQESPSPPMTSSAESPELVAETAVRAVLGLDPGTPVDRRTPLVDLGMDSILAVQLSADVATRCGLDVPIPELLGTCSTDDLVRLVARGISAGAESAPGWFALGPPPPVAIIPPQTIRLFCLPYAGGAAVAYRRLRQLLEPGIDVCALEFPGHGRRADEAVVERLDDLVSAVVDQIAPHLGAPFALFGHSFGAIVAFEVAAALARRDCRCPMGLLVSAAPAPDLFGSLLGDLTAGTAAGQIIPEPVLRDPALLAHTERVLGAELRAIRDYRPRCRRIDCPIVALCGDVDQMVKVDDVTAWRPYGASFSGPHIISGAHLYLTTGAEQIALVIRENLSKTRNGKDT